MQYNSNVGVSILKGKILSNVIYDDEKGTVRFIVDENESYVMMHEQDCCENVYLDDVGGDFKDLIGSEILVAEEVHNQEYKVLEDVESYTWTFYKFDTIKGGVTLRWLGLSNGYYSESVDFYIEANTSKYQNLH